MDDNYRKKNVSDTNISSIKSCRLVCYAGNKIYILLWHSFEIFIIKKLQKSLFCCHFCKQCFSCSLLILAKYLCFHNFSGQTFNKTSRLCFVRCFGNKIKDFLINGSFFSPRNYWIVVMKNKRDYYAWVK